MNTTSEKYQFVPIVENFIHLLRLSSTMTMYPSLLAFVGVLDLSCLPMSKAPLTRIWTSSEGVASIRSSISSMLSSLSIVDAGSRDQSAGVDGLSISSLVSSILKRLSCLGRAPISTLSSVSVSHFSIILIPVSKFGIPTLATIVIFFSDYP